jgi:hypothetical protein
LAKIIAVVVWLGLEWWRFTAATDAGAGVGKPFELAGEPAIGHRRQRGGNFGGRRCMGGEGLKTWQSREDLQEHSKRGD